MKYDYVIIGAGVSGISSALLLARFGFKVALLEQAARPAPLITGFVRNGVYFEGGFHYAGGLESGGVLDRNLRLLGVADDLQRIVLDETSYDTVTQPESGFKFSFPQGYAALQTTLQQQFPEQSPSIVAYQEQLQTATENLPYYNARTSLSPLRLAELHGQSLKDVLDDFGFSGDLRNLLQVHCLLYGARPEEIPFAIHAGVVDGYYRSAATFKGGGRALVKALVAALQRGGVDLHCRHQVTEIELNTAGKITGVVCAAGQRLQTSGCVSTLHPQMMLKLLPDAVFRPVYRRRLNRLSETASADIVFLRCKRQRGSVFREQAKLSGSKSAKPYKFAGRNFFFLPPTTKDPMDFELPLNERLLYLNFSAAGGVNETQECGLTAILPALSGAVEKSGLSALSYAEQKAFTGAQVRQRIADLLPELGGSLEVECVATRKTLQRINLSPKGSLYGVKQMVGQFNPTPKTRLGNFFLAGQAIAAPGLLGAITSALMAVGEIVGPEKMQALRREVVCDG